MNGPEIADLLARAQTYIWSFLPIFLRVGAAMALMPGFGEHNIPARVKLIVAVALTLIVSASLPERSVSALNAWQGLNLFEVPIGLMLGFMMRLFIHALHGAGMIIAQSISLSQMFVSPEGQPQPAISTLLIMAGLALAAKTGLFVKAIALLIASYDIFPIGQMPDSEALRNWGINGITHTFALAFSLALPFVLAGLIYNVVLGVINRAMPQFMVMLIGVPAILTVGLILLTIAVPAGLAIWLTNYAAFLDNPFGER